MSQRMTTSAVVGVIGLVLWGAAGVAPGAEFRTSVRGKTIVRQAAYQAPEAIPQASPTLGGSMPDAAAVPAATPPFAFDLSESVIDPMHSRSAG